MKIKTSDVVMSYTEEKMEIDRLNHYWGYLVVRRLSFSVAAVFINFGISATQVTTLGFVFLLTAMGLFFFSDGGYKLGIYAALFVNLWYLLDFVDGNVARYNKKSTKFGALYDWLIGHIYHVSLPIFVGIYIKNQSLSYIFEFEYDQNLLLIGVLSGLFHGSRSSISAKSKESSKGGVEQTSKSDSPKSQRNSKSRKYAFYLYAAESFKSPLLFIMIFAGLLNIWLYMYFVSASVIWLSIIFRSLINAYKSDITTQEKIL